jgi:predicted metal-binding protein
MNNLTKFAERHFSNIKEISSQSITLSSEVRKLCEQNKCGQYNKSWTCPPAVQSLEAFQDQIAPFNALLIVYQVYHLKSNFDWRGMIAGGADFKSRLLALKKEIQALEPSVDILVLGAGGCRLCDPCAYVDGERCRRPDDAIVSLEACGIDVMRLMKDNGLKYNNGKNTVTFIGGIFHHSG